MLYGHVRCKTCVRVWGQRQYLVYAVRATIINKWGLAVNNFEERPRHRHHVDSGEEFFGVDAVFMLFLSLSVLSHTRYDIIYVQNFCHMSIHVTSRLWYYVSVHI